MRRKHSAQYRATRVRDVPGTTLVHVDYRCGHADTWQREALSFIYFGRVVGCLVCERGREP